MKLDNSMEQFQNNAARGVTTEKKSVQIELDERLGNCDYDVAISAAGYGRYNKMLIAAAAFPLMSSLFSTSTISFILPSAECELELTNFKKGILNATIYITMIATAFVWGFLSDTFGRQRLICIGYALDATFNIAAGLSQSYFTLLAAKFLTGLICAGPYAVAMAYLAECNPDKYRATVVQWSGLLTAFGTICLPALAWAILPLNIEPSWLSSSFSLPAWRVFMLISTVPSILSAITFYYRWESPKFLLTQGREEEALNVLRQMYVINTGRSPESYPIKSLKSVASHAKMTDENQKSVLRAFLTGMKQIKPLFEPPYITRAVLIFIFQFGAMLGYNTLRLWMPQLFASILDAEKTSLAAEASSVCDLLPKPQESLNSTDVVVKICNTIEVDTAVYVNSIIIGIVTGVGFLGTSYITKFITDKTLIYIATAVGVVSSIAMYWGISSTLMLIFSSLNITATSISSTAILSITLVLFPTELRTMVVALTMMFGQIGGILGNIVFSVLIDLNCAIPFFFLAVLLAGTAVIAYLVPDGDSKGEEDN